MNKQNEFIDNQLSTGIHDSCSKSSYSSRFLQTKNIKKSQLFYQNQNNNQKKTLLPSRYEKAAMIIQRYWRLRQVMKRRVCERIIGELFEQNNCYQLQNSVLQQLITQYEYIKSIKGSLVEHETKLTCIKQQQQISLIRKQCVLTSFSLQKKSGPKKQLLRQLISLKQGQKQLNLMLNRQQFIIQQQLQQQKKYNIRLIEQLRKINMQQLQIVKQKNVLGQMLAQRLLQKSKNNNINMSAIDGDRVSRVGG